MGYKYKDLNYEATRERSTQTPGRVYVVSETEKNNNSRLFEGDLLLCCCKSGDCHYNYVRIEMTSNNGDNAYFTVKERVSTYTKSEAFKNMRTFTPSDLVHILSSGQVLISSKSIMTDEQVELFKEELELKEKLSEINLKKFNL